MKQLTLLVMVLASLIVPSLGFAWHGVAWDNTNQRTSFENGFTIKVGDTIIDDSSNTIATIGSSGAVTWSGAQTVSGAQTFSGSVTIGDASADVLTINADTVTLTAGAAVTLPNTAYLTQLRVGTGSTPTNNSATAADGVFIEGVLEADGAAQLDGVITATADVDLDATGGSTSDPDFSVDGYAKFAGIIEADGDVDLDATGGSTSDPDFGVDGYAQFNGNVEINNDDLIIGDAEGLVCGIDANSAGLRVYGSSDISNLRDTLCMTVTTAAVTVAVGFIDVSDVEVATISARDGSLCGTIADSTGNIDLSGALDVTGVATFDADVDMDATGGTAADPDLSVDGYAKVAGFQITASAAPPALTSTAAGTIWMTDGSPTADGLVSDGSGGTEVPQANELYVFNGTTWVPMFTGITP